MQHIRALPPPPPPPPPPHAAQELKARYTPLEPAACQPLWEKAYAAADTRPGKEGGEKKPAVARKKRLHILGGAVMRSWGAVQVGWGGMPGGGGGWASGCAIPIERCADAAGS